MDESEYGRLADAALRRIEEGLDLAAADLDYQLAAGGVLEIEFTDGSKMVVNKQSAAQEIWVAARSGGYHYRWDGAQWRDTRSGEELYAALDRMISQQSGETIRLN
jgi:CyaY protein